MLFVGLGVGKRFYFLAGMSTVPLMDLTRVTPSEAQKLLEEKGYVLLDVRAIPEFEAGRVPGAYNVPFLHKTPQGMVSNADFADVIETLVPDRNQGLVTHCAMGGRSLRAAQKLQSMGYTNVVDMRGGFSGEKNDSGHVINEGWLDSGLPVESGVGSPRAYSQLISSEELLPPSSAPESPAPAPLGSPTMDTPEGFNRFASDKRTVQCIKHKKELPGLKRRPYPGELGVRLYDNVSALAWNEWVEHSKMIINEYRIVSTDPKAMEMLYVQCEMFFFGEGVERPAEYVPPE